MHYTLFFNIFWRNKLIAIVNWIFHVSSCSKSGLIYLIILSLINALLISFFPNLFVSFFYSSVSKSVQISLISFYFFFNVKSFLILSILCVFGLLSFFALPWKVCLVVFVLKRLAILFLASPTLFHIISGIQLINQSYQVFLIGLILFIFCCCCSNVSISSIDTIIALKDSCSVFLLIFTFPF